MTLSYGDILITAVIVAVVLITAWRLGQTNPVGTGKLARRLSAVELKVAEQGEKLTALDTAVKTMAESTALTARELAAMRIEMAGDRGLGERTWEAVDRMQHFFMEEGFRSRRSGQ